MEDKKYFEYAAVGKDGKRYTGSYSAATKEEVVQFIFSKQLVPVSIDEVSRLFSLDRLKEINIGGVPLKEKMIFLKQFAIMINAGLSITRALEILSIQAQNPRFRAAQKEILKLVSSGMTLSDAMSKFPDVFDTITLSLIRAGEQSGNLDVIFRKLAREYEKKQSLSAKIQSALAYPAVITLVMIAVVVFLMIFVVPQLKQAFSTFGAELPWITVVVLSISQFLIDYWYLAILMLVGFIVGFRYYISTPQGMRVWHKFLIVMPIFGQLTVKTQTANFSRLLYLLLSSGVPILQSLELAEAAMTNIWFKDELANMRDQVKRGVSIAIPLMQSEHFPPIVGYMVNVGQETGQVDTVMRKIATYYELDIKAATAALSSLIEPILMVVMGIVVGGIIIAIYLPMFQLTQAIK